MKTTNKSIRPEPEIKKLMSIQDLLEFKAFISEVGNKNVILRIPLTAILKGSKVFGPENYLLGGTRDKGEKMKLDLNDNRMGIGIKSHLRNGCEEEVCTFWADLIWQGMDGKHSTENYKGIYKVMALAYKENNEGLDREFVYVRK